MREIGFDAYLTKPIKKSQLHDCLATVLGRETSAGQAEGQAPEPRRAAPLVTRHSLAEQKKRKVRILVAEDNRVNQLVALKMLEKMGYRADAVANGEEAVAALGTIPYDLVLMDCQMPVLDGYEATAKNASPREWMIISSSRSSPIR